jgi:hypothetical protein
MLNPAVRVDSKREFELKIQHAANLFDSNMKAVLPPQMKLDLDPDAEALEFDMSVSRTGDDRFWDGEDPQKRPGVYLSMYARPDEKAKIVKGMPRDEAPVAPRITALAMGPGGVEYTINTRADGTTWVRVLLPEERMPEEEPDRPSPPMSKSEAVREKRQEAFIATGGEKVDELLRQSTVVSVLVAYTKEAMCDEAGYPESTSCDDSETNKAPIEALIESAINSNNLAHVNSETGVVLELITTMMVDYTEPSSQSTALYNLTDAVGVLQEVHNIRNEVGGDFVALILNSGSGIAWVNSSATSAYSTTNKDYISGHTFAHELGHNWGCYHNRENSNTQVSYAHGYWDVNGESYDFRTILAYGCPTYCPRVNWYSSDTIQYNGEPTGASDVDCSRKIYERKSLVAGFTTENPSPTPPAPTPPTTEPPAPTPPAPTPGTCTDIEGWVDSFGDGCWWYETNDTEGCPNYGDMWDGGMGPPNVGCCFCGGGTSGGPAPTPPTTEPPAPTGTSPPAPTPPAPTPPGTSPPAPTPPATPGPSVMDTNPPAPTPPAPTPSNVVEEALMFIGQAADILENV